MFRKSGVQRMIIPSGGTQTPLINIGEMAAGLVIVPAGFTAAGAASIWVSGEELGPWQLFDGDGVTAITVNLQPDQAVLLPPEGMVPPIVKLVFAGATTREETMYFLHKS